MPPIGFHLPRESSGRALCCMYVLSAPASACYGDVNIGPGTNCSPSEQNFRGDVVIGSGLELSEISQLILAGMFGGYTYWVFSGAVRAVLTKRAAARAAKSDPRPWG